MECRKSSAKCPTFSFNDDSQIVGFFPVLSFPHPEVVFVPAKWPVLEYVRKQTSNHVSSNGKAVDL